MKHRLAFLFVLAAVGGLGVSGAACSSSSGGFTGGDDSGAGSDGTVDSSHHDGAADTAMQGDVAPGDSGPRGNCSPANGPACDIVLQNCPTGKECVLASGGSDAGLTTACATTTANEHIQKGEACATQQPNPCLPGLECYEKVCTPHCCMGDDSVCGMNSSGVQGKCDLNISSGPPQNTSLYMVCTYKSVCKPFKLIPCKTGESCTIEDNLGTADCLGNNGKAEGATCMFKNDCVDGTECLGVMGGPATCQMLCLTPGSMPPFDAGALMNGPGTGGCTAGKTCSGGLDPNSFPPWLSICK